MGKTSTDQADSFLRAWLSSRSLPRSVNLQVMQREGLSATLLTILNSLDRKESKTAVELASGLNVHPSTIVRSLDVLESRGYVARRRNAADRREVQVTLAPAGLAMRDTIEGALAEHIQRVFERMRRKDRESLLAGFQAFAEASGEVASETKEKSDAKR